MATLREMLRQARADGYLDENAEAKVCQDTVLKALSESTLCFRFPLMEEVRQVCRRRPATGPIL